MYGDYENTKQAARNKVNLLMKECMAILGDKARMEEANSLGEMDLLVGTGGEEIKIYLRHYNANYGPYGTWRIMLIPTLHEVKKSWLLLEKATTKKLLASIEKCEKRVQEYRQKNRDIETLAARKRKPILDALGDILATNIIGEDSVKVPLAEDVDLWVSNIQGVKVDVWMTGKLKINIADLREFIQFIAS